LGSLLAGVAACVFVSVVVTAIVILEPEVRFRI